MAGTRAGGKRAASSLGSDFYAEIGRRGGRNGTGHTFAHGRADPSKAGKVGGKIGGKKRWENATDEEKRAHTRMMRAAAGH